MNFKKLLLVITTLLLAFTIQVEGHEKKWPEKRLRQVWPTASSFTSKQISLSPAQIAELKSAGLKIGTTDQSPTFYFPQEKTEPSGKPKTSGIILFIDDYGDNGLMEISVAMESMGSLKTIDLWETTENSEVKKDDFLKQFQGKTSKDLFVLNKDFKPVPSAIKASEAVAHSAEKALKIVSLVYGTKK